MPGEATTTVRLDRAVGAAIDVAASDPPPALLAHPALALRPFGADADPALFPPAYVKAATGTKPTPFPRYWYDVQRADGAGYNAADVYLSEQVAHPLAGGYVLRSTGDRLRGAAGDGRGRRRRDDQPRGRRSPSRRRP